MDGIKELEAFCHTITILSANTQGRPTDWRGQQVSLAFAKLGVTCITLLRLIPGSSCFTPAGSFAVWDLSAVASQCRSLMEAYFLLCYLVNDPAEDGKKEFRQRLWEYHEEFERHEMLRVALPNAASLPKVAQELASRRARLEANPHYQRLSAGHRKALLAGSSFKIESAIELSRMAGISENYYRSWYKYCSAFAHSAPFAIAHLDSFRAGTEEAKRILDTLVRLASGYCAVAIRDFVSLFPDQQSSLGQKMKESISRWEGILEWERSPWFNTGTDNLTGNSIAAP
jgi:hypothetical protein